MILLRVSLCALFAIAVDLSEAKFFSSVLVSVGFAVSAFF
jgi:hypothetical protein